MNDRHENDPDSTPHAGGPRRTANRRRVTGFTVALVLFGLLLWAKLILVTGHPRTAIADPHRDAAASAHQQPEPAQPPANDRDGGKPAAAQAGSRR